MAGKIRGDYLPFGEDILEYAESVTLRVQVFPPSGSVLIYTAGLSQPTIVCHGPAKTFTIGSPRGGVYAAAPEGTDRFEVNVVKWSRTPGLSAQRQALPSFGSRSVEPFQQRPATRSFLRR